jgi:glycosyltransferase involved in cell wall biosynthesis
MVCGTNVRSGMSVSGDKQRGLSREIVDGIDVIALPLSYSNNDSIFYRTWIFLRFAYMSVKVCLKENFDLVFATSTPLTAAVPGIIAKWVRSKPFVFEVRDLWPQLPKALGMKNPFLIGGMSLLEWMAYRSADAAIGLSPGIVEGIKKRSRADLPVEMIPNGCDLGMFKPKTSTRQYFAEVSANDFLAGFTGALGIANGLDAVVDAAVCLKKRGNDRIKIAFIGDGRIKKELVKKVENLSLDNCFFMPPVSRTEMAKMMPCLDAGLMILKNVEAFYYGTSPNKFFDYLSCGLPVVNNYPGWVADMIADEGCGIAVPPDDPEALANALESLRNDSVACKEMGTASRSLAERSFSRKDLSSHFCDLLEHVMNDISDAQPIE